MLGGWQGTKHEAQGFQGWKRTFRPLWHSTLVSEAGSNSTPCAIPGVPVNLLCCLFILFVTYSEDFCHNLGMLLLSSFNMDTKAKCPLQQIFIASVLTSLC